jgi:hypothetical protein
MHRFNEPFKTLLAIIKEAIIAHNQNNEIK